MALEPKVAVIGCSNSRDIEIAYRNVSTRDVTYGAAAGGLTLQKWAQAATWQMYFDPLFRQYGASAVWYPICMLRSKKGTSQAQAWSAFLAMYQQLRARTSAPLYVTDKIGNQESSECQSIIEAKVDVENMKYVADRAVTEGLATRSEPDIPPADHPIDCGHFDPYLSTNVGEAAAQFLDG
jgi:hypothetical protein